MITTRRHLYCNIFMIGTSSNNSYDLSEVDPLIFMGLKENDTTRGN